MSRQDFGRTPFAVDNRDVIYLPSIRDTPPAPQGDGPHVEPISTSILVNADKTRKTHFGYDETRREIQLSAYWNTVTREDLNLCYKVMKEQNPDATCMSISISSSTASQHLRLFESANFARDISRDEPGLFVYTRPLRVEKLAQVKKAPTEPLTYAAIAARYVADGLVVPESLRRDVEREAEMLALRKRIGIE